MGKGILETFDLGFAIEVEVFDFAILAFYTEMGSLASVNKSLLHSCRPSLYSGGTVGKSMGVKLQDARTQNFMVLQ